MFGGHFAISGNSEFFEGGEVVTLDEHLAELQEQRTIFDEVQKELDENWEIAEALTRAEERERAVRIISENKGNPGAAMSEILGEQE
jgi:uncharacterized protein YjaG (DUF416 family)